MLEEKTKELGYKVGAAACRPPRAHPRPRSSAGVSGGVDTPSGPCPRPCPGLHSPEGGRGWAVGQGPPRPSHHPPPRSGPVGAGPAPG